jgi:hypothetical protein
VATERRHGISNMHVAHFCAPVPVSVQWQTKHLVPVDLAVATGHDVSAAQIL